MKKFVVATRDRVGSDIMIVAARGVCDAANRVLCIYANQYERTGMSREELQEWAAEREWVATTVRPLAMLERYYRMRNR